MKKDMNTKKSIIEVNRGEDYTSIEFGWIGWKFVWAAFIACIFGRTLAFKAKTGEMNFLTPIK